MKVLLSFAAAFLCIWLWTFSEPAPFVPPWIEAFGAVALLVLPSWAASLFIRRFIPGLKGILTTLALLLALVFLHWMLGPSSLPQIHLSVFTMFRISVIFWSVWFVPFYLVLAAFELVQSRRRSA